VIIFQRTLATNQSQELEESVSRLTQQRRQREMIRRSATRANQAVTLTPSDKACVLEAIRHNTATFIRVLGRRTSVWRVKVRGVVYIATYNRTSGQVTLTTPPVEDTT